MARTPKTPEQRTADVVAAMAAAPDALSRALAATNAHGADSPEARRAWLHFNALAGTAFRQSRLNAGLSRGG